MCGIIALQSPPNPELPKLIETLLEESQIRGKHATGISYCEGGAVKTIKEPVSADQFQLPPFEEELSLIGHCRYSTSDLAYNQPIADESDAIAHNGVITQSAHEQWGEKFGYQCSTKNDSELALHSIKAGKCPLVEFPDSSIAIVHLDAHGRINFGRNGSRPLWWCDYGAIFIVASTSDILVRAFKRMGWPKPTLTECHAGAWHSRGHGILSSSRVAELEDKQIQLKNNYPPIK